MRLRAAWAMLPPYGPRPWGYKYLTREMDKDKVEGRSDF